MFEIDRLHGRENELRSIKVFFGANWPPRTFLFHQIRLEKFKFGAFSFEALTFTRFFLVCQIVAGAGAVGKTLLAKKYIHLHDKAYSDGVFHFNCETYISLFVFVKANVRKVLCFGLTQEESCFNSF